MQSPENIRRNFLWTLNALLGLAFIVDLFAPDRIPWLDVAVVILASAASIVSLNRQLPLQNVLPAALITAGIGGLAHGFSAQTFIPLGPVVFNLPSGGKLFDVLPWTVPLIWVAAIFTARGVGRLILRPWRKVKVYGYWLIALTTALAVAFDVAFEPFAWHVKHWWLWQPTKLSVNWHGAPLMNFFGWGCVTLFTMFFITPFLIRKQPGGSSSPDYHSLCLWLGALLMFAVGAGRAGLWSAVVVDVVLAGVTTFLAVRGARW